MIMNADCKGALAQINNSWKAFMHKGKSMTKAEVKAVLQYAVQKGYPHTGMLTDEEVDNILQQIKNNHQMTNTCPACKSTNTKDASIRENNGIYGPGAASWVVEEKSICNDCGIYFKPMGNEPRIETMNRTICEYMELIPIPIGTKRLGDIKYPEISEAFLNYHKDWAQLMPVVEKIESLENSRFGFTIDVLHVVVTDYKGKGVEIIWVHKFPDNGDTKLSMTYDAVYQFITWLNQQKQKDGTE